MARFAFNLTCGAGSSSIGYWRAIIGNLSADIYNLPNGTRVRIERVFRGGRAGLNEIAFYVAWAGLVAGADQMPGRIVCTPVGLEPLILVPHAPDQFTRGNGWAQRDFTVQSGSITDVIANGVTSRVELFD